MAVTSIRARLTAWYGVILTVTLVGLGAAVYALMSQALLERIDAMLDFELDEAAEWLASDRGAGDPAGVPAAFHETYTLSVLDAAGLPLQESPTPAGRALGLVTGGLEVGHATMRLGATGSFRVSSRAVGVGESRRTVRIATSLASYEHELADLRGVLWTILPAGVLAATIVGYALAGRTLAPVGRMADSARRISAANLGERVQPADSHDELGRLGATLNEMLDRIDRAFTATQRFTGDAAHELKTPVASIRAVAEVALLSRRGAEEYEQTLRSIVEETDRLSRLADRLLLLSREDLGAHEARPSHPVQLDTSVRSATDDAEEAALRAGVVLRVEHLPDAEVMADRDLFRQVFDNLLDNAIKYTPAGGTVTVRGMVEPEGPRGRGRAVVEVIDSGIGIPADALPWIFDRFYRVDPSRSRRSGGTGLGLSIARVLVERHGGSIEATSRPGAGSTFRVRLPLHDPSA